MAACEAASVMSHSIALHTGKLAITNTVAEIGPLMKQVDCKCFMGEMLCCIVVFLSPHSLCERCAFPHVTLIEGCHWLNLMTSVLNGICFLVVVFIT